MLPIILIGVIGFLLLKCKEIHLFRRYLYSNASHLMLFASDSYKYVPIRFGKVLDDLELFIIAGHHDNTTTLRKYFIWDP